MAKKILTHKKAAWAAQWKPKILEGETLIPNAGISKWYEEKLSKLVAEMTRVTERELKKLFNTTGKGLGYSEDADISSQARILLNSLRRRLTRLFDKKARDLAESMIARTNRTSSANVHSSLKELSGGLSIKTNFISGKLRTAMKASIAENVSLIRSIPEEYQDKVTGAVMRSITTGNGMADLVPQLEKIGGINRYRARLIAQNETKKAISFMNRYRMMDAGVTHFKWIHTGRSRKPRPFHKTEAPAGLNGGIFRFDDPPVIDKKTGERGFPGQLINCTCRMKPVIRLDEEKK